MIASGAALACGDEESASELLAGAELVVGGCFSEAGRLSALLFALFLPVGVSLLAGIISVGVENFIADTELLLHIPTTHETEVKLFLTPLQAIPHCPPTSLVHLQRPCNTTPDRFLQILFVPFSRKKFLYSQVTFPQINLPNFFTIICRTPHLHETGVQSDTRYGNTPFIRS